MKSDRNTEQDIIFAAQKVFQEKGYKEATMRDIASEANINMAMVHYYFRCKENLFFLVLDEAFRLLVEEILEVLGDENLDIFDKIRAIVRKYVIFFSEKPYLPQFLMGEVIRDPKNIGKRMHQNMNFKIIYEAFSKQLNKEFESGAIKKISPMSLLLNIISLCVFPAVVSPLIVEISEHAHVEFDKVFEARKDDVAEFIIKAISI